MTSNLKFIADNNVGKLAKWLRMMGYDTLFFTGDDDWQMVRTAMAEDRVILTRDTQVMKMGVVTSGRVRAILIESDEPRRQVRQVVETLDLDCQYKPFTVCLECNEPLVDRSKQQVKDRVPPYVFKTQNQFMECPACHRIYWRATHWQAMTRKIRELIKG